MYKIQIERDKEIILTLRNKIKFTKHNFHFAHNQK